MGTFRCPLALSDLPDIQKFRLDLSGALVPSAGARRLVPHHRKGERFLKGPIPWAWLAAAGRASGQGLHVALVLWLESGMKRSATVPLAHARLAELGVTRFAAARGLKALETAGLVSVERRPGCSPRVTISAMPVPPADGD